MGSLMSSNFSHSLKHLLAHGAYKGCFTCVLCSDYLGQQNDKRCCHKKTQLKCESAVSTLLVNINNIRYRESLITLKTIIMFVMSVLKNLKCPIMEAQVLCLFFWCFGYFWFYDRVHSICFGVFWHMIICHFCIEKLMQYHFMLDVVDQLKIREVF